MSAVLRLIMKGKHLNLFILVVSFTNKNKKIILTFED